MNNGNQQPAQRPMSLQQQQQQLWVRPEDIRRLLPHYNDDQKQHYEKGTRDLYTNLERLNENDPNRQNVIKKLTDVSLKIRTEYKKYQTLRQQQQQAGQAQTGQGQTGQPQAGAAAPPQGGNRPATGDQQRAPQPQSVPSLISAQIAASVQTHLQEFPFTTPPELQPGTEAAERYLADAKHQYARALNTMQTAKAKIDRIREIKKTRAAEGKPLNATGAENAQNQERSALADYERANKFLDEFRARQSGYPRGPQRGETSENRPAGSGSANGGGGKNPISVQIPATGAQGPGSAAGPANSGAHQIKFDEQPSANQERSQAGPNPQAGNPAQQQPQLPRAPNNQTINTAPQQRQSQGQHSSPVSAHPPSAAPSEPARAWSHQEAMAEAARSYGAGGHNTPGGPPAPFSQGQNSAHTQHSQPPMGPGQGEISTTKMPIPKFLPNPPPHPVSMGPSRPTYSGGASNSATGMMSQPAFQKAPPYELGGEGERVLSKKKLDELVRQVTGGNEGLGGEGLSAEVEEHVLQIADDFVDQVTTAACRLAKLRSSSILEIRDIQLILERNYNIRIPGYSSDEIRQVRKVAPAVGWSQKMSAVQAAKVTKDKGDL